MPPYMRKGYGKMLIDFSEYSSFRVLNLNFVIVEKISQYMANWPIRNFNLDSFLILFCMSRLFHKIIIIIFWFGYTVVAVSPCHTEL